MRLTVLAKPGDPPETAGVMLETRLDFPVELTSGDTKWEALVHGQQASFAWDVRGSIARIGAGQTVGVGNRRG